MVAKINKSTSFDFNSNSFDLLKYWAALSVMLLHYTAYALKYDQGMTVMIETIRHFVSFFPGVVIFFAISGFLVTSSYERSEKTTLYLKKRVFRLFPSLWLCTLVNLVVIVLLARDYIDQSLLIWIVTQIAGVANTPSCLKEWATGSVNGALWTIFVQLQLFVSMIFVYGWLKRAKALKWSVFGIALFMFNVASALITTNLAINGVNKIIERLFLPYALWFYIGVFCYMKKDVVVKVLMQWHWVLLIVYVLNRVFHVVEFGYYTDVVTGLLLPFIVIGIAYRLGKHRVPYDLTYEMFLYHWIVINIMIHFDMIAYLNSMVSLFVFVALTILLGVITKSIIKYSRVTNNNR